MALPQISDYPLPDAQALPKPRASFVVDPARAALLIHDMQRYFCASYGADWSSREGSTLAQVVANIAAIAAAARARGMPVFYTAQHGNQLLRDRGLQADLWGPGMRAVPEHQEIIPELAPEQGDIQLVKHRYSAFQRSNLETLLRARDRDQLIITGVYAHIGCLATATEAFQRDVEPFIIADAVADFSQAKHAMALDWIASCSGVPMGASDLLGRLA